MTNYQPRNDFVLIREVAKDMTDLGVALPSASFEGKDYVVEAMGPKVTGLDVGDKVLMVGKEGEDWGRLPRQNSLLVTRENNVLLIMGNVREDPA